MKIVVNGEELTGVENLPPDTCARYKEAMRQLDANGNGTRFGGRCGTTWRLHCGCVNAANSRRAPLPDIIDGWRLVLTGLFIFALCAAGVAGLWCFFLR
ncbi:MAG TPA: hypothetical protein VFY25_05635 [Anaerolineales bacterium]|nr:hypothetical protein [Anaerolineales bacterium]